MRLLCTVCVINRTIANKPLGLNQQQPKQKYLKSTLALCKQPKSDSSSQQFCIILFNNSHKTGMKYQIADNINQILIRFINEGKATLQFKEPPHDFLIQAEVPKLKQFLTLLKKILQNKLTPAELKKSGISGIGVTALDHKTVAPTKLCIRSRSDYPLKGLPSTLEILQINDIQRMGFDKGILKLFHLRVLDLAYNKIEYLPEELNKLPCLVEINMKSNLMGKSAPRKWDWMGGNLSKTLKALNLSNNELHYVPDQIVRLHSVVTLNLDENYLRKLPSSIGQLKSLKILTTSDNQISSLPGSMKRLNLDTLDICSNPLTEPVQHGPHNLLLRNPKELSVLTLREIAGQVVLGKMLPYNSTTLPFTLIKYLELAQFCVCGKACFTSVINHKDIMSLQMIAKEIQASRDIYCACVPVDIVVCSAKCYSSNFKRMEINII